jgi:hypothetical protein
MEPRLKQCRACGECSEKMKKCPICKEMPLNWSEALLLDFTCAMCHTRCCALSYRNKNIFMYKTFRVYQNKVGCPHAFVIDTIIIMLQQSILPF